MLLSSMLALVAVTTGCSRSASEYLAEGRGFADKGDVTAAVISYKNAVQKEPDSLPARIALAEALERADDATGAEQQYRRALELNGDPDVLVPRIALLLLDRGEAIQLIKDFGKTELKAESADAELRGILALAHLSLGQSREAGERLEWAHGKSAAVSLARAQLALLNQKPQEALAELDAVLREGAAPWWVWRSASRVYAINGDRAKALDALKRAHELAPGHRGVIGEYAESLIGNGRNADARPLLNTLNKIAPTYFRTIYLNALFMMDDGRYDDAWSLATKVLAKLPEHMPSQLIAATVELQRGELASVETRLAKVLAKDPNSLQALRLRTFLELRKGNQQAADAALAQALKVAPNNRDFLALAAELEWSRGNKEGALKQLATAAALPPPQARLLARMADMQADLGKRAESQASIDKAIELAKNDVAQREEVFRTAFRLRLLDKAKALAQLEIERDAKNPAPYVWLAAALGSEGNQAAALEQIRHALDLRADYFPALSALGMLAKDPERVKEYEVRMQRAVDANGKDARVYLEQARRLSATGAEQAKIVAVLEKGVAANPNSTKLHDALASYQGRRELKSEGEAPTASGAGGTAGAVGATR